MRVANWGMGNGWLATGLLVLLAGCDGKSISAVECADPCAGLGPHDVAPAECSQDFGSPEGGELRLEFVEYPSSGCGQDGNQPCGPEGSSTTTRVTAYELLAMTPNAMSFPNVGACNSMVNGDTWPTGQGTGRVYADMGELSISGGPSLLEVPSGDPLSPDAFGRLHDNYKFYEAADDTQYISQNTSYSLNWTGDADHPARELPDALYMPGAFSLIEPAFVANLEVANTGDFQLSWGDEGNAEIPQGTGPGMLSFVALGVPGVGITHLCLGPDTGSVTIPSAMVEEAAALAGDSGKATLIRAKMSHQLDEVTDECGSTYRRIDLIGMYSYINDIRFVAPN